MNEVDTAKIFELIRTKFFKRDLLPTEPSYLPIVRELQEIYGEVSTTFKGENISIFVGVEEMLLFQGDLNISLAFSIAALNSINYNWPEEMTEEE